MSVDMLFEGFPDPELPEPSGPPSAPRRRSVKVRHQAKLDRGVHPITGRKLADNGHTCGDCLHRVHTMWDKRYPKCDLTQMSRSESSDCRAWYPACTSWEPRP